MLLKDWDTKGNESEIFNRCRPRSGHRRPLGETQRRGETYAGGIRKTWCLQSPRHRTVQSSSDQRESPVACGIEFDPSTTRRSEKGFEGSFVRDVVGQEA